MPTRSLSALVELQKHILQLSLIQKEYIPCAPKPLHHENEAAESGLIRKFPSEKPFLIQTESLRWRHHVFSAGMKNILDRSKI